MAISMKHRQNISPYTYYIANKKTKVAGESRELTASTNKTGQSHNLLQLIVLHINKMLHCVWQISITLDNYTFHYSTLIFHTRAKKKFQVHNQTAYMKSEKKIYIHRFVLLLNQLCFSSDKNGKLMLELDLYKHILNTFIWSHRSKSSYTAYK